MYTLHLINNCTRMMSQKARLHFAPLKLHHVYALSSNEITQSKIYTPIRVALLELVVRKDFATEGTVFPT